MPRFRRLPILTVLAAGLLALPISAVHKKNAGPTDFELKFKLPPPAPLSPEEEQKTFKVEPGFRIELVASEPMIESPVAMSFDDQGRLYVVEMRGYMRDMDGTTETEPLGRVSLLEDTDGDGRMDKSTVFLDGLVMPRAVMAVNGGALVSVPPNLLFCKDTDGDGKADVKEPIATDYATAGGQPEHMANSPTWMLDNCVWSAGYGSRFRLRGGVWQRDVGLSRGQWGLCQDDYGRLYYNYNSDMLRCDLLPAEAFARNPLLRTATSVNAKVAVDQSVWPSHPTPGVNRGYDEKTLRSDGTLSKATAACGALVYRGDAFPVAYRGNAFVPEPGGNLLKRFVLQEKAGVVTGSNAVVGREFLTSTDERFRPVQAANGPDGALYIVDMYRGIIQHTSFLTHYLIANIEARKLEQPFEQGRIWRIVPNYKKGERPKAVKIPSGTEARVQMLSHANGWVRDAAQRTLVESGDAEAAPLLSALLQSQDATPLARLHALWTLDGLMLLSPELQRVALSDASPRVRAAAVRIATRDLAPELIAMTEEKDTLVRAHLAIKLPTLGLPDADAALAKLLVSGGGKQTLVLEGALTGLRGRESAFAAVLATQMTKDNAANATPVLDALATLVAQAGKAQPFEEMLDLAAKQPPGGTVQYALVKGLATSPAGASKTSPPKLVWLDQKPASLDLLKKSLSDKEAARIFNAAANRVAWPGKPGAPPPPKIVPLTEAQAVLFEKGKVTYHAVCAACHQPHGFGLDGLAPPLVDSEWVLGNPDVPARIVMHGLAGPMKVGSRTWNLAMPPLMQLNDEDVAGVVTYIRREWDHNASPVESKTITELRAKHVGKVMWTAEELMPPKKKP